VFENKQDILICEKMRTDRRKFIYYHLFSVTLVRQEAFKIAQSTTRSWRQPPKYRQFFNYPYLEEPHVLSPILLLTTPPSLFRLRICPMPLVLVKKAAFIVNLCQQWLTHLGWVAALGTETLSHCKDPFYLTIMNFFFLKRFFELC
jgi:hypothetical protein